MALSRKKIKRMRIIAFIIVIAVVLSFLNVTSALGRVKYVNLTKSASKEDFITLSASDTDYADPQGFSDEQPVGAPYEKSAENESLILYTDKENGLIKLYDKRSMAVWDSVVEDEELLGTATAEVSKQMRSLLVFSYIDLVGNNPKEQDTCSFAQEPSVQYERIKSGIRLDYDFDQLNIKLSVEISLDGDMVSVKIPDDKIFENIGGVEKTEKTRAETTSKIELIRNLCKDIKSIIEKNQTYSDSEKKLITLSANNIVEALNSINAQLGIGEIGLDMLYKMSDSVSLIEGMQLGDNELTGKLAQIVMIANEISENAQELSKNKTIGLTRVQLFPYFGAQTSKTDGYAFYPDRNGAISYFSRPHSSTGGRYLQDVYDSFIQSLPYSGLQPNEREDYTSPIVMPVFGVKAKNSAYLAIITDGEYDSAIGYVPNTANLDCANIYPQFYIRKNTYVVFGTASKKQMYDSARTKNDWGVRYSFLSNEKANYSGMAETYRDYLEKTKRLQKSEIMDGQIPLALEFFMGAESTRSTVQKQYVTMTRYSDIDGFIKSLEANGVENILLSAVSWTAHAGAIYNDNPIPSLQTGGGKGLSALASYMKTKNYTFGLSIDNVFAEKKNLSSQAVSIAAVKDKSRLTLEYFGYSIMNPGYVYNKLIQESIPILEKSGVNALKTVDLGRNLYFDYNERNICERKDTALSFLSAAKTVRQNFGSVILENPNSYMFSTTDWNMYLPNEDSGFIFTDENIPFLQMVIHGYISYTGEGDNYRYDTIGQKLKAIEYGYLPFYFLTKEKPYEIKNEGYGGFFSTACDDWLDSISAEYASYKKDFGSVWNKKILSHHRTGDDIAITAYEGGIKVYVNYSDKEQEIEGIKVDAKGYKVA